MGSLIIALAMFALATINWRLGSSGVKNDNFSLPVKLQFFVSGLAAMAGIVNLLSYFKG
jgi:hypothetical protein